VQGGLRFGVGRAVLRIVGDEEVEETLALMPANELFVVVVAESHAATLPHLGRCETAEGALGRLHLGRWRRRCRGCARGRRRKRQGGARGGGGNGKRVGALDGRGADGSCDAAARRSYAHAKYMAV
jgi:hypothetical protein